jgi:hypothetical protein
MQARPAKHASGQEAVGLAGACEVVVGGGGGVGGDEGVVKLVDSSLVVIFARVVKSSATSAVGANETGSFNTNSVWRGSGNMAVNFWIRGSATGGLSTPFGCSLKNKEPSLESNSGGIVYC